MKSRVKKDSSYYIPMKSRRGNDVAITNFSPIDKHFSKKVFFFFVSFDYSMIFLVCRVSTVCKDNLYNLLLCNVSNVPVTCSCSCPSIEIN